MISICRLAAGLFGVLLLAVPQSCCQKEGTEFKIEISRSEGEASRGTQWLHVTAQEGKGWMLSTSDDSGQPVDWLTADPASGIGTASVSLTWDANPTSASRTAIVKGVCGGSESTVSFIQQGSSGKEDKDYKTLREEFRNEYLPADAPQTVKEYFYRQIDYASEGEFGPLPTELVSDEIPAWMELPATDRGELYFITHGSSTSSGAGRNYSYYWDSEAMVAHWVAYSLNKGCIASGSRTNAWGLDLKLPYSAQPVLYKGFSSSVPGGSYDGGTQSYQRGHQCPSADRLANEDNRMTFYGTNMTPQVGDLNERIWAAVETRVRDWSKAFDTLYVVTGCVIDGSTEYAYDNVGNKVTVPVGYYKALLGYSRDGSRGISSQTKGYTGVAFYFEHRGYTDNDYMKCAMTIDALEEMVGEDFFVNLPAAIGNSMASKVESTRDDYWWSN